MRRSHDPHAGRLARRHLLAAAVALPALAGCGTIGGWFGGPSVELDQITLSAMTGINNDSPIAVDLVIVYDTGLIDRVAALTAHDWFGNRAQMQRDFPNDLQVIGWEVVPGQTLQDQPVDRRGGARAGFIFANYFSAGDHRLRLGDQSELTVRLLDAGFTVTPEAAG
jgi:type VI secretion system protein